MNLQPAYLRLLVALLLTSFFSSASALEVEECFSQSPNLNTLGSSYYSLTPTVSLTSTQKKQMRQLIKSLSGKWVGQLTESNCKGSERLPKQTLNNLNATADIVINSYDELQINVRKTGYADHVKRYERLQLLSQGNLFSIKLQDDQIDTVEKYRLKNANQASRLLEVITILHLTDGQLVLNVTYYSNSVFVQHQSYTLSRE